MATLLWFQSLGIISAIALSVAAGPAARAQQPAPPAGQQAAPGDPTAEKVKTAMALLQAKARELGPPEINGEDTVAGKRVPALFFGSAKMNNNFTLVDEVQKEVGGTATLFVKSGDEFVRVATNVRKDDGSRAIGTILDSKGKAIAAIRQNEPFYGEVDILGKPYITGYEPIRDAAKNVIGIYYVGYMTGK